MYDNTDIARCSVCLGLLREERKNTIDCHATHQSIGHVKLIENFTKTMIKIIILKNFGPFMLYRKIPNIGPGLIKIFKQILGAYIREGLCSEGILC